MSQRDFCAENSSSSVSFASSSLVAVYHQSSTCCVRSTDCARLLTLLTASSTLCSTPALLYVAALSVWLTLVSCGPCTFYAPKPQDGVRHTAPPGGRRVQRFLCRLLKTVPLLVDYPWAAGCVLTDMRTTATRRLSHNWKIQAHNTANGCLKKTSFINFLTVHGSELPTHLTSRFFIGSDRVQMLASALNLNANV